MEYCKYYYWIAAENLSETLKLLMEQLQKNEIPQAQLRQCESLYQKVPIMHIPPNVWSKNCVRQGSWFRSSDLAQAHLIVSNIPLNLSKTLQSGTIEIITIKNPPQSSVEEYSNLLSDQTFIERAPLEWFTLLDFEIPLYNSFLERNGAKISLEEFWQMHSANHANFLLPENQVRFKVVFDNKSIPISLFPQTYICSACMEIFGVIGSHLPQIIIKKCPGLKYVNLAPYEYFLITILH